LPRQAETLLAMTQDAKAKHNKQKLSLCHCEALAEAIQNRTNNRIRKMQEQKQYYIYIITNFENGTLYTGVTNNLIRRIYEHKNKVVDGFTKKYDLDKLVYYETIDNVEQAILREKQIKGGSRKKKLDLINKFNKDWKDLYEDII